MLLSAALCAETAPKRCSYVKLSQLPLQSLPGGPYVEASVNGKAAKFLVDTGGFKTSIATSFAERIGLPMRHSSAAGAGVGGVAQFYTALVDEFAIGSIRGKQMRMAVLDHAGSIENYGGIIGADFLFQRDLELVLAESSLRFFHPVDCADAFLAYWDKEADFVPLESGNPNDARPMVTVSLNGKTLLALLDTGASITIVDGAAAKAVGVSAESLAGSEQISLAGIGARAVTARLGSFDSFSIGGETVQRPKIWVADLNQNHQIDNNTMATAEFISKGPKVILGTDFLKAHRLLFANSQNRLYFSYLGGHLFAKASKNPSAE
ncbi:retropepsin-like domain-containing protein [Paucibacter sp. B2R-40]|nr:retropepsin-like domain-containing protein [Paucibacter sp. B2R-40]